MPEKNKIRRSRSELKERIHSIIFEADTSAGKTFDVLLLVAILLSVFVVMLETVPVIQRQYDPIFIAIEWILTIFFTIEYILRLYCVYKPIRYAKSFFGVIDLLAIIPTYLSVFVAGSQSLLIIRALRLLRVFRIFKLGQYMREGRVIIIALQKSGPKLLVFILFVLLMVTIFGSVMYLIEGGVNPAFDSIPRSVYWAIVTLTTVGYGDISPVTSIGQFLAAGIMILGYAVIAVPTGIVAVDLARETKNINTRACLDCGREGHDDRAHFCKHCGGPLP